MTRTFVELPIFQKKWKSMGLNDKDLKRLQEELLSDPKAGAVIQGTAGFAKCVLLLSIVAKAAASE